MASYLDQTGLAHFKEKFTAANDAKYALKGESAGIATADKAGIVKPGDDFDISSDGTISLYESMRVDYVSIAPNTVERGATVNDAVIKWGLNKTPKTLMLNTDSVDVNSTSKTLANWNKKENFTATVKATDARGAVAQNSATLSFLDKRHWFTGAYDADGVTDAVLNGATGELATGRQKTFSVTAADGDYIYYAYPHSWGTPSFFVGGFEGGFSLLKTFDHVNASGATVSYDVYKSGNAGLGDTTVEVR